MLSQAVQFFILGLTALAAVYGAARARSAERAARGAHGAAHGARVRALAAQRAAVGARSETRAVLGSLGYAHGSLEVISKQLRQHTRDELVELEHVEWTPLPANEIRATPRNDDR